MKGTPNKNLHPVREAMKIAFEHLQDVTCDEPDSVFYGRAAWSLVEWAKRSDKNLTAFYQLCVRLVPVQVEGGDPTRPILLQQTERLRELPDDKLEALMGAVVHVLEGDDAEREGLLLEYNQATREAVPVKTRTPASSGSKKPRAVRPGSKY